MMHSDFDYKKFMHGTIKISPNSNKLATQYVKSSKGIKVGNVRRNRSVAKQLPPPAKKKPENVVLDQDRASKLTLTVDHNKVSKTIGKAAKNAKINNEAL